MAIFGKIYQLTSESNGNAFLNVLSEPGLIGVWGSSYKTPTILVEDKDTFYIMQFDSKEYFQEWMLENKNKYSKITKIKYEE